jgi:curved DNA-binding protein CbpA
MSTVDLYDVLKVSPDCNRTAIKVAYGKLVKIYHPDKPTGDTDMFELITHAFHILSNSQSRIEYDKIYKISQQSKLGFVNLKEQYKNYETSRRTDVTQLTKDESNVKFKKEFNNMDNRHNINRVNMGIITSRVAVQNLRDLELTREQDDIENMQTRLFDNGRFDSAKFNQAFDTINQKSSALIPHEGNPNPWDGKSVTNYSSIKTTSLYGDANDILDDCLDYAPIRKIENQNKLTKEDVNNMQGANYTISHNQNKNKPYIKSLEEKIAERNRHTQEYGSMDRQDYKDYTNDPTLGGYGFMHEIGGDTQMLHWDNDEDIKARYNRLLEQRNKDINHEQK